MNIPGWMIDEEAEYLTKEFSNPSIKLAVEIGTWLGQSAAIIADALATHGGHLITIDHHKGNAEHQPGGRAHNEQTPIVDGKVNTWPGFKENIKPYPNVLGIRATSGWMIENSIFSFDAIFIDGEHDSMNIAFDLLGWGSRCKGAIYVHDYDARHYPIVVQVVDSFTEHGWKIAERCARIAKLTRK